MPRTIILENQSIEYELKQNARSKSIRLAVYPGGRFVISIPKRMDEKQIEKFLFEKKDWILAKRESMKKCEPVNSKPMSKLELKRLKVVA